VNGVTRKARAAAARLMNFGNTRLPSVDFAGILFFCPSRLQACGMRPNSSLFAISSGGRLTLLSNGKALN
jgi:hypothetical protein